MLAEVLPPFQACPDVGMVINSGAISLGEACPGLPGSTTSPSCSSAHTTEPARQKIFATTRERTQHTPAPQQQQQGSGEDQDGPPHPAHVLPRGSRVRIVGNQRCSQRLIGQEATVRRSVGLGGWHWLVLSSSGEEVKLQRNALVVLEYGQEDQESDVEDSPAQETPEIITRPRIRRPPRSLSPVPDIRKKAVSYGCRLVVPASGIDLQKLNSVSLQRYSRKYNLVIAMDGSRGEALLLAVAEHFRAQAVMEHDVLVPFMQAVRRRGGDVLDV